MPSEETRRQRTYGSARPLESIAGSAEAAPSPTPTASWATALPWVEPPADATLTPLAADRSCDLAEDRAVPVSAPGYDELLAAANDANVTAVEKQLSGGASALDGDSAVVVSYNENGTAGAVWALGRTDGTWEQTAVVQTTAADQLGWGVAVRGDTFVVGAPGATAGREVGLIEGWMWAGRGEAVVVARDGPSSPWRQQAVLSPTVADDTADFGTSVAIAGECLALVRAQGPSGARSGRRSFGCPRRDRLAGRVKSVGNTVSFQEMVVRRVRQARRQPKQ